MEERVVTTAEVIRMLDKVAFALGPKNDEELLYAPPVIAALNLDVLPNMCVPLTANTRDFVLALAGLIKTRGVYSSDLSEDGFPTLVSLGDSALDEKFFAFAALIRRAAKLLARLDAIACDLYEELADVSVEEKPCTAGLQLIK